MYKVLVKEALSLFVDQVFAPEEDWGCVSVHYRRLYHCQAYYVHINSTIVSVFSLLVSQYMHLYLFSLHVTYTYFEIVT